jgi:hypothetical protein
MKTVDVGLYLGKVLSRFASAKHSVLHNNTNVQQPYTFREYGAALERGKRIGAYKSMTTSPAGWAQHTRTFPCAGMSSGSGP